MEVSLRLVFNWTCPECGRDHYHLPLTPDFGEEEVLAIKEKEGLSGAEGDLVHIPDQVFCKDCNIGFDVVT